MGSDRVRLLENERNQGYIRTLKRLIAASTTDVVGILDADDLLEPEATAQVLDEYAERPSVGCVYTNYTAFGEGVAEGPTGGGSEAIPPGKSALTHGYVTHLKTFRVAAYQQTSGLDEALAYAEDRDLVYKLEEVTELAFVDRRLYRYRSVPGSQSRDPEKTLTGFANHLRAQLAAVQRRKITGLSRVHLHSYFLAEYVHRIGTVPDLRPALSDTRRALEGFL